MAAFERISRMVIHSSGQESLIDVRTVTLAKGHPRDSSSYDPRKNRAPVKPIKTWEAYFNLLRSMFGAGVLAMPLAISQSGFIMGPLLTIAFIILLNHTHHMLLDSLNEVSRRLKIPYISYRYGFRIAILHGPTCLKTFGKIGPHIIGVFMFLSQLGICCVFLVFVADSMRDIMDWENTRAVMLAIYLPMLGLVFLMKDLKIIGYVSMLGNTFMLSGLVLTLLFIFSGEPYNEYIILSDNIAQIMMAVGIILFNHSSIGVILSIDKALPDPNIMMKRFGILDTGMVVPALVGMAFGCFGYWKFGVIQENVLRSLPFDDHLAIVAFGLYSTAVALTYPVQCFPGIELMLEVYKAAIMNRRPYCDIIVIDYIVRIVFVALTFAVMACIPFQGPFVAFVGSLCTSQLTLTFPALMEISLLYPGKYGPCKVRLVKNLLIIVLGLFISMFGAVTSGYIIYLRLLF